MVLQVSDSLGIQVTSISMPMGFLTQADIRSNKSLKYDVQSLAAEGLVKEYGIRLEDNSSLNK